MATAGMDAPTNGEKARAAEGMLNRKRLGLESAIEALELVGYRVSQDAHGAFHVTAATGSFANGADVDVAAPSAFLGDYPDLLTVDNLVEILGVSDRSVYRMCANEELPSIKVGRRVYVPKQALIAQMTEQEG